MSGTKTKIDALIDTVASAPAEVEWDAAQKALATQTSDVLLTLAQAALVDAARRRRRGHALSVERGAEFSAVSAEVTGPAPRTWTRPKVGTRRYEEWVATTPEGAQWDAGRAEDDERAAARLAETLGSVVAKYRDELRIEWTNELLETEFARPDGTRVTWGHASIADHQERAGMFEANAHANLEGAARHLKAIADLQKANAASLSELVQPGQLALEEV